jgi:cell shape-determining protein MreC
MTRYRFDNQEQKEKLSRTKIATRTFIVIAVVLLCVFVLAPIIRNIVRGPAWLRASVVATADTSISMLSSKKTILANNNLLKAKIQEYEAQSVELQSLRDENQKLRAELSYISNPSEFIGAQVIAKPSQSLFNTLIIDQGSNAGIKVGQLVTVQGSIGLGTISSVSSKTATVELFTGPQFSGDLVMRNQNITVPAIGKGSGNFEIHIPREIKVIDGDILEFPDRPSIAVGVVKSIIFDARDPFQTILARIPVNVQELRFVEVVK